MVRVNPRTVLSVVPSAQNICPPEGRWWWVCHAFAAHTVGGRQPVAQGRESMPPSHTSLSLLQIAISSGSHAAIATSKDGRSRTLCVWVGATLLSQQRVLDNQR